MAATIDYANLTLMDALDVAILIEDEARERYGELAEQLELHRTGDAARFFRNMVFNEGKHADRLRERRRELFGDEPSTVDPTIVPEIEAPAYDSVRAFMSEHWALRVALLSEQRAADFYSNALERVSDAQVKSLFDEMHAEEVEHVALVEALIAKLPPEDTTDPDGFVDPPVPQ